MNKHFKIAAIALALVTAPLTYNTVFANPGGKPSTSRSAERGVRLNRISLLETAAKSLNLTVTQLDAQLKTGQTLTSLAVIQKVSLETVKNAVLGDLKAQLSQAVKDGKLTQAQADQRLTQAGTQANFGLDSGRGDGKGMGGKGQERGRGGERGGARGGRGGNR
jgi:hypothetical protein